LSQRGKEYPTNSDNFNWIGNILRRNHLLKHVIQGKKEGQLRREDEEEDVTSYYVTWRKRKDTGN